MRTSEVNLRGEEHTYPGSEPLEREVIIKKEDMEDQSPISYEEDEQTNINSPSTYVQGMLNKWMEENNQEYADHAGRSASSDQNKSDAMIRAEEIQPSLEPGSLMFIKKLATSHVCHSFGMALPSQFCKSYLPNDTTVMLEDENMEQFAIKYYAHSSRLRGGWRKFVIVHKLIEGDVLVFHLVGPNKFKVYIVRVNDSNEVSGASSLSNLESRAKQNEAEGENQNASTAFQIKKRDPKYFPSTDPSRGVPNLGPQSQLSEADSKDIKSFEDFHIMFNRMGIVNEVDSNIQTKYYYLCKSVNVILHEHIFPGLNSKLIAGMITEIVSLADAIRGCKFTTSRDEFRVWENSLESSRLLGFNVGFLSDRLCQLMRLGSESDEASHGKSYIEAIREQACTKEEIIKVEEEMCSLESKLVELKEAFDKIESEIQTWKFKAEMYERKFDEQANAPW